MGILSYVKTASILGIVVCIGCFFSSPANAYSPSITLDRKVYKSFMDDGYAYSSLFRSGRDGFHWLDLGYGQTNYLLDDEVGRVQGYGSFYRFAKRQRWARFFKPAIFIGAGLYRRTFTNRYRVSDGVLQGKLDDRVRNEGLLSFGGGYVWEVRNIVVGLSLSYGYDFGYKESFYSPVFFFSYQL